jgi:hypothetical protein
LAAIHLHSSDAFCALFILQKYYYSEGKRNISLFFKSVLTGLLKFKLSCSVMFNIDSGLMKFIEKNDYSTLRPKCLVTLADTGATDNLISSRS